MRIKKMINPVVAAAEVARQKHLQEAREALRENVKLHLSLADVSIELIRTCFTIGLKDLKSPEISTKVGATIQTVEGAFKRLRSHVKPFIGIDPNYEDLMQGEHAYEVYRLMKNLAFTNTEHLRKFNDGVEQQNLASNGK
ncbi:hypothetical protein E2P86_08060 [Sphingobacterium psychroaquaticum]|uniref:hypothetical protein n=1 Tax=Sphingobacterium psychroaquaticum TaxID=561061 RepID=UPI001069BFD8|nr:hypothetical protein [Sphingobacterium psychroaquaticum]QBQ41111.1 hypothetical protein E2P86_08060 [Sphingobacterium psychroaquaticum]